MAVYQLADRIIDPGRYPWGVTGIGIGSGFDHGPGPKEMDYDEITDTGYYGEVSHEELLSGSELETAIGYSTGTDTGHSEAGWLKFYVGENAACNHFVRHGMTAQAYVLFVAKKPFRCDACSWDSMYDAGIVFGTGDSGPHNSGSNTTQDVQVEVDGRDYIVRLLLGADANDSQAYDTSCADNPGENSEWNMLMYRIHEDVPDCDDPTIGMPGGGSSDRHGGPQVGDNWAEFTDSDIVVDSGNGRNNWFQERDGNDNSRRVLRGMNGVAYFFTDTAGGTFATRGWRPCLQLVQG